MVHIGCGADVIRQRRRADAKKKEAIEQGLSVDPKSWKPARNKKYPHFTPARNSEVFNQQKCNFHRLTAVQVEQKRKAREKLKQERILHRKRAQLIHQRQTRSIQDRRKPGGLHSGGNSLERAKSDQSNPLLRYRHLSSYFLRKSDFVGQNNVSQNSPINDEYQIQAAKVASMPRERACQDDSKNTLHVCEFQIFF